MFSHYSTTIKDLLVQSITLVVVLSMVVIAAEPTLVRSQPAVDTQDFIVRQQITPEISLVLSTTTVTMNGAIQGISGGNATGTIQAVVTANAGYLMTIAFENDPAMLGDTTGNNGILNYPSGPTPTLNFTTGSSAYFGYTVNASTTSDLPPAFLDNNTNCGITIGGGGTQNNNRCWKEPTQAAFTIIDRSSATMSGSTSTITFRINVPNNPSPSLEVDWYTATATLTATTQ